FIVRQATSSVLVTPSSWGGFDYRAMAEAVTEGTDTRVVVVDDTLPDGDPTVLPPAPDDDMHTTTGDVPVRYLIYTSGTTAGPTRARLGARARRYGSVGMAGRVGLAPDDRLAFVLPVTDRGGGVRVCAARACGLTVGLDAAFNAASRLHLLRRETITQGGAGT